MFHNIPPDFSFNWNRNSNYGQNFVPFNSMYCHPYEQNVSTFNSSEKDIITILNNRKCDEEFLNNFMSTPEKIKNQKCKSSKISETKNALLMIKILNKKLMKLREELKGEDLSEKEWIEQYSDCEETKKKVQFMLQNLRNGEFLKNIKKSLERCRKKRLREKRVKESWKKKKIEMEENRTRLHNEADIWIKSRQNIIDKEKQEESLRKDADLVLFDVRAKRNDAKKYLTLLKELEHLRKIKVSIAKSRGECISSAADDAFNSIIEKLTQQWTVLDREYSLEEQGLKLMIKTDNESKIEKQTKNPYDCWETAIFGKKIPDNYFLQSDMNAFITIRSAWDKFLNANEGTPIPLGWIIPNKPSSSAWQKCLKKE